MQNDDKSTDIIKIVEDKATQILELLQLTPSEEPMIQLKNAMCIHKYIVQNCKYDIKIEEEKKRILQEIERGEDVDLNFEELYNGLINKRGVCTTQAIVFRYLLSKIGMIGNVVLLHSKEDAKKHASILVEIGEQRYYFDTMLEQKIIEQSPSNAENFTYYCVRIR